MARTSRPVWPTATAGQAKNASAGLGRARRGTSTSRRCDHRRTGTRRRCATRASRRPCAAERGVLPLGRPPVGADAELLVEVDLAAGGLEDRAEHPEEPAEPGVVAGHGVRATEVEHEVVGEDLGQGVVVLVEDRLGHPVHGLDVGVVAHRSSKQSLSVVTATVRSRAGRAHRAKHPIFAYRPAQSFYRCRPRSVSVRSSRCADRRSLRTVAARRSSRRRIRHDPHRIDRRAARGAGSGAAARRCARNDTDP